MMNGLVDFLTGPFSEFIQGVETLCGLVSGGRDTDVAGADTPVEDERGSEDSDGIVHLLGRGGRELEGGGKELEDGILHHIEGDNLGLLGQPTGRHRASFEDERLLTDGGKNCAVEENLRAPAPGVEVEAKGLEIEARVPTLVLVKDCIYSQESRVRRE
jgi:hypothetical protein